MSPVVITNTLKSTCMHASGLKCGPWGSISVTLQISYISIDHFKRQFNFRRSKRVKTPEISLADVP